MTDYLLLAILAHLNAFLLADSRISRGAKAGLWVMMAVGLLMLARRTLGL